MFHQLHNSLTRILTPDGSPVGVGFLAAENLILTCAHVIEQAIGQEEKAHFDFPLLAPGVGARNSRRCFWKRCPAAHWWQ